MSDDEIREIRDRLSIAEKQIAAHVAACEVRHGETQRRFDSADTSRTNLYAQMQAGFGELRGMFTTAHADNRTQIHRVDRGSLERSFDFAKALLLVCVAGALGYFLRR